MRIPSAARAMGPVTVSQTQDRSPGVVRKRGGGWGDSRHCTLSLSWPAVAFVVVRHTVVTAPDDLLDLHRPPAFCVLEKNGRRPPSVDIAAYPVHARVIVLDAASSEAGVGMKGMEGPPSRFSLPDLPGRPVQARTLQRAKRVRVPPSGAQHARRPAPQRQFFRSAAGRERARRERAPGLSP